MCLYTRQEWPSTEFEDIECYKILIKSYQDGILFTPYVRLYITKDFINSGKYLNDDSPVYLSEYFDDSLYFVSKGYIHSYETLEKAIDSAKSMEGSVIYKCIIPRMTVYYRGINKDLASKTIKFIEQVWEH